MCCRPRVDKGQMASAPQWQVVSDFISRTREQKQHEQQKQLSEEPQMQERSDDSRREQNKKFVADVVTPIYREVKANDSAKPPAVVAPTLRLTDTSSDVIDLAPDASEASIVDAILRHCSNELVECPITPP